MTVQFTSATKIATRALELVGAITTSFRSPRPGEMEVALEWLDLAVKQFSYTKEIFWLIETNVEIPLIADKRVYNLSQDSTAITRPKGGILLALRAVVIEHPSERRTPIDIIRQTEYDEQQDFAVAGGPDLCAVNRQTDQMSILPVPAVSDAYTLELRVQAYPPDLSDTCDDKDAAQIDSAWTMWAIHQTAYHIGSGPVRRLPESELRQYLGQAEDSAAKIEGFINRAHRGRPQQSQIAYKDLL